jgi:glucose/arabinose dehydrogenase
VTAADAPVGGPGISADEYAMSPTHLLRIVPAFIAAATLHAQSPRAGCAGNNAGLTLPPGFCVQVVADSVGAARHIAVAPNGDILIALRDTGSRGGVLVLRDANGDGVADQRGKFGPRGGTGLAFFDNHVYFATDTSVVRWRWRPGELTPASPMETIVTELAVQRGHAAKTIAIASDGSLYVNIGAPSNSCQEQDRQVESKGLDPCPLLARSGGIWRFDARRPMQKLADGTRFATGLRNMVAVAIGPDGATLWGVQHGRDLLGGNWSRTHPIYTEKKSAENPAEELFRIDRGVDFGWPYCYYDVELKQKVLAPEYGGDGRNAGRCATVGKPLVAFPGHWAPESIVFYTASQFPAEYRGGAFVAFHGSWNRGPLPPTPALPEHQAGFNVSFVPYAAGRPAASYRVFADGFRGAPNEQRHRPMGLAVAGDGSLIVGDDRGGRIFRIRWTGQN